MQIILFPNRGGCALQSPRLLCNSMHASFSFHFYMVFILFIMFIIFIVFHHFSSLLRIHHCSSLFIIVHHCSSFFIMFYRLSSLVHYFLYFFTTFSTTVIIYRACLTCFYNFHCFFSHLFVIFFHLHIFYYHFHPLHYCLSSFIIPPPTP